MVTSHLIGETWLQGSGPAFRSIDPATGDTVWFGRAATADEVGQAVASARAALGVWSATPLAGRIARLEAFGVELQRPWHSTNTGGTPVPRLAHSISLETGKPAWEAAEEVAAMIAKIAISIQASRERRNESATQTNGVTSAVRFKPHGVLAVLGPFNFPGHLPNGHIVPALLAGNTIVFKPSEMTPRVAQQTVEAWQAAGLPPGVLNLVQGGGDTGAALSSHDGIDGLLFTGSVSTGLALHRAFAGKPQKMLALEMGGNNPLIVSSITDIDAAVESTIRSAFLTAGQRCTCARRLIVPAGGLGDRFIDKLVTQIAAVRIGRFDQDPPPFMGPVISDAAADRLLAAQDDLRSRGGRVIVPMTSLGPRRAMLSPGLMDVTGVRDVDDAEHFGPFLQLIRVADFDAAIREANRTAYGLAAGLLSDRREEYDQFQRDIRAGIVNWNRPTTGASGKLPFGGIGLSGNHRPSGYWATDYCSYPVASMEAPKTAVT